MNNPNRKNYRKVEKPLPEFRKLIDELDLDTLDLGIQKVLPGLTTSQSAVLKARYRNFLYLCGATGEVIVPTPELDKIWHAHLLDTVKYREDCERIFGFFLDHYPYFGLQGDAAELEAAYVRSCQLYEAQFGEAYEIQTAASHDPALAQELQGPEPDRSCG
jgi:hypothetical protein